MRCNLYVNYRFVIWTSNFISRISMPPLSEKSIRLISIHDSFPITILIPSHYYETETCGGSKYHIRWIVVGLINVSYNVTIKSALSGCDCNNASNEPLFAQVRCLESSLLRVPGARSCASHFRIHCLVYIAISKDIVWEPIGKQRWNNFKSKATIFVCWRPLLESISRW